MNNTKFFFVIVLFLLINQSLQSQQFSDYSFLETKKIDSVTISSVNYRSKEFTVPLATEMKPVIKDSITGKWELPYPDSKEVKDTIIVKSIKKLTKSEISNINNWLKNRNTYPKKNVALLNHYDVEINFYRKGKIFQYVRISSLTKKIVIKKENCKTAKDKKGNSFDKCFFYGYISKKIEKKLYNLIN